MIITNNVKYVLSLTLIFSVVVSCNESKYDGRSFEGLPLESVFDIDSIGTKVIPLEVILDNRSNPTLYDSYLEEVKYVTMETSAQSIIPEVKYCIVSEEYICLCSGMKDNTIVVFDHNGKFVNSIRSGRGPGELQELHGAYYSSRNNELIVLSFPLELSYFSPDGIFSRKVELPFYADAVAQVNDGYIFRVYGFPSDNTLEGNEKMLIRTDFELNEISRSIPFKSYIGSHISPFPVSDIVNQSFYSQYPGYVYLYQDNKISSCYSFDTGKYSIPNGALYDLDSYSILMYLKDNEVCSFKGGYYETNTHLFINASVVSDGVPLFIDKSSYSVIGSFARSMGIPFGFPMGTANSQFVSLVESYEVCSFVKKVKEGKDYNKQLISPETLSKLEQVQTDDNPVLIFYRMKSF